MIEASPKMTQIESDRAKIGIQVFLAFSVLFFQFL